MEMRGCKYRQGGRLPTARTLQVMSASYEIEWFANIDTISACIFGFVVVDVNCNADSVIPVSE